MQAVATIRANGADERFPELMHADTLGRLERMHEWVAQMAAPDGTMPAFGDYGAYTQRRFLERGAALFGQPDLCSPTPSRSVALPSHFTILRDDTLYMSVDHGPLGGQHSHVDTLGFVAYAGDRPIALDTGIGISYNDPRYVSGYRDVRAHNVIVIDDIEPEKVAERLAFHTGADRDTLVLRSHAYTHAYGIVHERAIVFLHGIGWVLRDRLTGPLAGREFAWHLHTPVALQSRDRATLAGDGLLVLAGHLETLQAPILEMSPASVPVPEVADWRLIDAVKHVGAGFVRDIISLKWPARPASGNSFEFVNALIPSPTPPTEATLACHDGCWTLRLRSRDIPIDFATGE